MFTKNLQHKFNFVLTTSILSSLISTALIYQKGLIYNAGDNVYPLSANVFYNANFFGFLNWNGGSLAVNNLFGLSNFLFEIFLFPFFHQYSEIISFFIDTCIGSIAISLIIYKYASEQSKIDVYVYFVTLSVEILTYIGINWYYMISLVPAGAFPIFLAFPWVLYFIDSAINAEESFSNRVIKLAIAELLLITFVGTFATLLLVGYSTASIYFLVSMFLSNIKPKQKITLLSLFIVLLLFLNSGYLLPLYLGFLHRITSSPDVNNYVNNYIVPVLKVYMEITEGQISNALTLSFYRIDTYMKINPILRSTLIVNLILALIPLIIKKVKQVLPALIPFILLTGWLAAPYMFSFYIHLYASLPILWSLDYPYISFPYFITITFILTLGIGLGVLNTKKPRNRLIIKTLITSLLIMAILVNFSVASNTLTKPTQFPSYLYKISNEIGSSNIYNPRILVFPLTLLYDAYNFSNNITYIGAGFWPSLLKGNVYASYYSSKDLSLLWFINYYPLLNSTYLVPVINAMRILGINYVIVTKNIIPQDFIPKYNITLIRNFEKLLQNYPLLFNNSQMTVYNFSYEGVIAPVKDIILVNISGPLTSPYKFSLLQKALSLNFVNYSNTIILPKSSENYLLKYLDQKQIEVFNISSNITVITVNINTRTIVTGNIPNNFRVLLLSNSPQNGYIPLIVRYNYYATYRDSYSGNYSNMVIIPAYSNETYLLLIKSSSSVTRIQFEYTPPIIYYNVLIYPVLTVILIIYLIYRKVICKYFAKS